MTTEQKKEALKRLHNGDSGGLEYLQDIYPDNAKITAALAQNYLETVDYGNPESELYQQLRQEALESVGLYNDFLEFWA